MNYGLLSVFTFLQTGFLSGEGRFGGRAKIAKGFI
jgi:hypothetical protein